MYQTDAVIIGHRQISEDYNLLRLSAPETVAAARPGQFIHLRVPALEATALRRPFSIYDAADGVLSLIYKKVGRGTAALATLHEGVSVNVMGPLGNGFPLPDDSVFPVLVGGGYGVAPLVFLARSIISRGLVLIGGRSKQDILCLEDFKSINWDVRIATQDGSLGATGLVTELLEIPAPKDKQIVYYACGPDGMLRAIGEYAQRSGTAAWLSLDKHMVCAVGACLSCIQRIRLPDGREKTVRVCKDGPVFNSSEIVWPTEKPARPSVVTAENLQRSTAAKSLQNPRMQVNLGGIKMQNPVTVSSGTFGYGQEYASYVEISKLGAVTVKGICLREWGGNRLPRHVETVGGMVNAIGLQGPGVEGFIRDDMPYLRKLEIPVIVNIWGVSVEEYAKTAALLSDVDGVAGFEINVSCPNVKAGGAAFGTDIAMLSEVVKAVRKATTLPIMPKLAPNVPSIAPFAKAAADAGADAISLINTIPAMVIDIETRKPVLANKIGGLSGAAIHPVAVKHVYDAAQAVKIPILAMGGIMNAKDAVEFIIAGATAVSVGTANFIDPSTPLKVVEGIREYLSAHSIPSAGALSGSVLVD